MRCEAGRNQLILKQRREKKKEKCQKHTYGFRKKPYDMICT